MSESSAPATAQDSDVEDAGPRVFASDVKIIKSHSLYFADGDIVLAVECAAEKKRVWLYRVDRIFLARHYMVFADMFKLPSVSPDLRESYDGVPLVRLVGDDVKGAKDVLKFIYNPGYVSIMRFSTCRDR